MFKPAKSLVLIVLLFVLSVSYGQEKSDTAKAAIVTDESAFYLQFPAEHPKLDP